MAVGMLRTCYVVSHRLNPGFQAEYSKNLSRRPGGEGFGQNGPQTTLFKLKRAKSHTRRGSSYLRHDFMTGRPAGGETVDIPFEVCVCVCVFAVLTFQCTRLSSFQVKLNVKMFWDVWMTAVWAVVVVVGRTTPKTRDS